MDTIVENPESGERFIESGNSQFSQLWEQWMLNHDSAPCPMPRGHQMFKSPASYGCRFIAQSSQSEEKCAP